MTYLEYTNIALQAINEVPLTSQQFATTRGLHQFAKDTVNRVYFDIIGEYKWPWMIPNEGTAAGTLELSGERSLIPTSTWITIPVTNPYKDSIEWETIYYKDSEELKYPLKVLSWNEFEEMQEEVEGCNTPKYIVQSADGRGLGLFALPTEKVGKLYYKLWERPSAFTLDTDVIPMPDLHSNVLIDGILHHLWNFRADSEQSQIAYQRFTYGLKKMKQKYTNQTTRMRWV